MGRFPAWARNSNENGACTRKMIVCSGAAYQGNRSLISTVFQSVPTLEGAGVHLKRGFGCREVPAFDPLLLLDYFHSVNPFDYLPGFSVTLAPCQGK
jgi:hypothetical protein